MIKTKQELFEAMDDIGLPTSLRKIWDGDIPKPFSWQLEDPTEFFDDMQNSPQDFPSPDELLILWGTNGESLVGYLPESGVFIRYYVEDSPDEFQVLGTTYQQAISEKFASFVMQGVDDQVLRECAEFLEFQYYDEIKEFVNSEQDWVDNTAAFIAELEKRQES